MKHESGTYSSLDNIVVSFTCLPLSFALILWLKPLWQLSFNLFSLTVWQAGERLMCCCVHCTYSTGGVEIYLFLFLSLSLHNGGSSLVYNMLSRWIPPIRSLWKLLSQSSGLIKCIFFNPFLMLREVNRGTLNIYSPFSEHRKYYSVIVHRIQQYQLYFALTSQYPF